MKGSSVLNPMLQKQPETPKFEGKLPNTSQSFPLTNRLRIKTTNKKTQAISSTNKLKIQPLGIGQGDMSSPCLNSLKGTTN